MGRKEAEMEDRKGCSLWFAKDKIYKRWSWDCGEISVYTGVLRKACVGGQLRFLKFTDTSVWALILDGHRWRNVYKVKVGKTVVKRWQSWLFLGGGAEN